MGPGDPELLTLRAARTLARCDTVLHAGPRDDAGFAFEVVAPLLRPEQTVRGMALAMRRGPTTAPWDTTVSLAHSSKKHERGGVAAFLTEGDPMLFGTGSYVVERLRTEAPDVAVEVVPGVSAMSAAAAKLGIPLAQKDEILTVCPATYHLAELGALLDRPGAICFLKAADILPVLIAELRLRGRLESAALVERIGRPDERIIRDLTSVEAETLSYFSLVLVR